MNNLQYVPSSDPMLRCMYIRGHFFQIGFKTIIGYVEQSGMERDLFSESAVANQSLIVM